jgi:LPXTG-motif cell wall-anchored protein
MPTWPFLVAGALALAGGAIVVGRRRRGGALTA